MSKPKSKSKKRIRVRQPLPRASCRRCSKPPAPGRTCCVRHITEKNAELQRKYNGIAQGQLYADTGAGVWITRAGSIIPIDQMSDSHLANSIALLVRKLGMLTSEAARRAREAELQSDTLATSPSGWEEGWG